MIDLEGVLQTGLTTLSAVAFGWACARWGVLERDASVHRLNQFVWRACLPALQLWLIAAKTDMRRAENWSVLGTFLAWSLLLQALTGARHLLPPLLRLKPRAAAAAAPHAAVPTTPTPTTPDLGAWAVDGLLLAANNTGILGPVVLEAALGARYAPLGMLATVVLYFQQLPMAAALLELHSVAARGGAGAGGVGSARELKAHYSGGSGDGDGEDGGGGDGQALLQHSGGGRAAGGGAVDLRALAHHVMQRLVANPLVWTTGVAVLLSTAGSSDVLGAAAVIADAAGVGGARRHRRTTTAASAFAWLEEALAWFGRCAAPLTLFTTGMWMEGGLDGGSSGSSSGTATAAATTTAQQRPQFGARQVLTYLALRATLAPALMILLCRALGTRPDLAAALVVLSVLPVAQTAFVVCEQYKDGVGTRAIALVSVASVLVMLPQLAGTLWLLQRTGVLGESGESGGGGGG